MSTAHLCGAHYIIEGVKCGSARAVWRYAVRHYGFTGEENCIAMRLKRGATTWREIAAPVAKQATKNRTTAAAKKAEMSALCAEIDARKAKLSS